MSTPALALLTVAAVSALSLLSAGALLLDDHALRRIVPVLVNLAVGTLVGAACFDLIPDAIHRHAGVSVVIADVIAGYVGFAILDRALHLGTDAAASSQHALILLNMGGDLLHNFVDGALVAAGFLADPTIGIVAAAAIALHEIPRELGSLGIFLHAGLSRGRAIALNVLSSISAFVGAGMTLLASTHVSRLAIYALPIAAGTFLYLAQTIARQSPRHRTRWPLFVVGLVVTALAAYLE